MIPIATIKVKIEQGLPGAKVEITDPRKDGRHLKAIVLYKGFKGKSLIDQHRMVYGTLRKELKEELHTLSIETHEEEE